MTSRREFDTIVIGGGFFGCSLALHTRKHLLSKVALLEKQPDLMQRASFSNQARVHNGYHYPRSLLTALRCRVNFPRFIRDFSEAIVSDYDKYYAVSRVFSNVTAGQFKIFCERIRAPLATAPEEIRQLFDSNLIEEVFVTREVSFDATRLKIFVTQQLQEYEVDVRTGVEAQSVRRLSNGLLEVTCSTPEGIQKISATNVLNCTYSRLNSLLVASGLPAIRLKQELTEMALVRVPDELQGKAFTVMCGPFFSIMPFPPRALHVLSHVRYTPHCEWFESEAGIWKDPFELLRSYQKITNYPHMIRDASRYMPCLDRCEYVDSIWEVKTVLPRSEVDDSRPVLYRKDWGLPNLTSLLGGKIDNIYDIIELMGIVEETRAG